MSYISMIAPFEYSQLKTLQDDDEFCKEEAKSVFHERDAQEGEIFRGVCGVLFQRMRTVTPDRVLLPLALRAHVVRKCHEAILQGHREHHTLIKTLDMISTLFYFRGAHDAARSLLRNCTRCASYYLPNSDASEAVSHSQAPARPLVRGRTNPPRNEISQLHALPPCNFSPPRNQGRKRGRDNHRRHAYLPHQNQGQAQHRPQVPNGRQRQWNAGQVHLGNQRHGIVAHTHDSGAMTISLPGNVEIKIPA